MHHHYTQCSSKESKAKIQIINKVSKGKVRPLRNDPKWHAASLSLEISPSKKKLGVRLPSNHLS